MNIGYYPGCALHGSSNDYEQSLRATLQLLEISLIEVEDWICCGATAAHCLNHKLAIALPARNLALAAQQGLHELLAPCPMCSMELLNAAQAMSADISLRKEIAGIVEGSPNGTRVLNLIQLFQGIGLDKLKLSVQSPLKDLNAACYYGCLLTRPPGVVQFDDCERPETMEQVVEALGAKTVEWNYKTECCGAGMTLADEGVVLELSHKILRNAASHGANCIVVACPMCHVNLDMKQRAIEKKYKEKFEMVIYYLSDLVGLALGLSPEQLGVNRHFVEKQTTCRG